MNIWPTIKLHYLDDCLVYGRQSCVNEYSLTNVCILHLLGENDTILTTIGPVTVTSKPAQVTTPLIPTYPLPPGGRCLPLPVVRYLKVDPETIQDSQFTFINVAQKWSAVHPEAQLRAPMRHLHLLEDKHVRFCKLSTNSMCDLK